MRIFLFTLLTIGLGLSGCSQTNSNEVTSNVASQIDQLFKDFEGVNTPGYAIGISKNGKTLYKKGFGAANLDYDRILYLALLPFQSNLRLRALLC